MCHPGLAGTAGEGYDEARAAELAVLTDPAVRARLDAAAVLLTTFARRG